MSLNEFKTKFSQINRKPDLMEMLFEGLQLAESFAQSDLFQKYDDEDNETKKEINDFEAKMADKLQKWQKKSITELEKDNSDINKYATEHGYLVRDNKIDVSGFTDKFLNAVSEE